MSHAAQRASRDQGYMQRPACGQTSTGMFVEIGQDEGDARYVVSV